MCTLSTTFSLPEPTSLYEIKKFYSQNSLLGSYKDWLGKSDYVKPLLDQMFEGQKVVTGDQAYDQITLHLLRRAMHQVNEACNKLWSTIELHHHLKSCGRLCWKFSPGFVGSTAVPTLHYANISSLISILSLYGIGSWVRRSKGLTFFNIVRTNNEIRLSRRDDYLRWLLGKCPSGWHNQILATYEGLLSKGVDLPKVDLEAAHSLLKSRTEYHYDVLSHTTMYDVYGAQDYFRYLATTLDSTFVAIEGIIVTVGSIPNGCDERLDEILQKVTQVADSYGCSLETHIVKV